VIDNLARGFDEAGHDVLLCASGDSTCPVETTSSLAQAVGTECTRTSSELPHVINGYDAAVEWGAQIVHDHTLAGPFYGRRHDVPIVATNHNQLNDELSAIYRAMAESAAIVAISHHQAATATTADVPTTAVIHHGIDVDRFPMGAGGDYALFLGRMSPVKGVDAAIRVARAAGVPLRIAAKMRETEERRYFESSISHLLGDGVDYVGEVGPEERLELLANARCLLNPIAWAEPFGLVMVEALACGTPVVARPFGSVPEIVTDGVTGFVRDTESDLADALAYVEDLDRDRCRKEVAERFSIERMVDDYAALFERVAR
jgi:glycosyltransferase involved in cell wall biosynthesis